MIVRKVTYEDVSSLVDLYVDYMKELVGRKLEDKKAIFLHLLNASLKEDHLFLLIEDEEEIKGFILGYVQFDKITNTDIMFAEHVYLNSEIRATGALDLLIKKFKLRTSDMGLKEINFMAIPKTAKFWIKKGYEVKTTIFKEKVGD